MLYVEIMREIAHRDGKSESRNDSKIRRYIRDNHRHADLGKIAGFIS